MSLIPDGITSSVIAERMKQKKENKNLGMADKGGVRRFLHGLGMLRKTWQSSDYSCRLGFKFLNLKDY